MTYTRKQVVTTISVIYLILTTALAAFASHRKNKLSLPISNTLSGFTTFLPVISGLLLECGYDFTRRQERQQRLPRGDITRPPLVIVANTIIFIYSTAVITLLGTHVGPPNELDCGLRARWQSLFRSKKSKLIQEIQDAFNCCGFANTRDMAWPFPNKTHDALACERTFGRTQGCLGPWKQEERNMAGLLMGVVGLVFIWQMAIIVIPTQRESWLHRVAPDRISRMIADERHGDTRPRRAIDYLPDFGRYQDNVAEEDSDPETGNGARRTIEGATQKVKNAVSGGNGNNDADDHHATVENEWARN